jgi:hypothetical protein
MRSSAAARICFACAPSVTRILSSRRRLLTVYDARPKVPAIEGSYPKAPDRPSATVATWDTKKVNPGWFFQRLDSRTGIAGSDRESVFGWWLPSRWWPRQRNLDAAGR